MIRQMTATEVKARLLALLDDVEAGEEIEITRRGVTIARLTPARGPSAFKGMFHGVVTSTASDEELSSTGEHWEAESRSRGSSHLRHRDRVRLAARHQG